MLSIPAASKCCFGAACIKPPQSSSSHSESAGSDPNQSRQPPPPLRTNQKAPNEPDAGTRCNITTHTRRHSVQCHPTHNAVTRCMQIHYLSAQGVPGRPRSLAPSQQNRRNPQIQRISRFQSNSCKFHEFPRFPVFVGGARERGHPERKDSDFRGVALPGIALRVSRKLRAPRRRICEYLVWRNTEYLVHVKK